jgi:DNA-directed RNA polymerase subunit RPC12/RpoP
MKCTKCKVDLTNAEATPDNTCRICGTNKVLFHFKGSDYWIADGLHLKGKQGESMAAIITKKEWERCYNDYRNK